MRKESRLTALALVGGASITVFVLWIGGLLPNQPRDDSPVSQVAFHSYGSPLSIEEALPGDGVDQRDFAVARGRVTRVDSAFWNTADGTRPVGSGPGGRGTNGAMILRTAHIKVEEQLFGDAAPNSLEVTVVGGFADGVQMTADTPQVSEGQEVVIFLVKGTRVGSFTPDKWSPLLVLELEGEVAVHPEGERLNLEQLRARVAFATRR